MRSPGLDRLRAESRSRTGDPYLLTVTAGGRPHCETVTVTWDGPDGTLIVTVTPGGPAPAGSRPGGQHGLMRI